MDESYDWLETFSASPDFLSRIFGYIDEENAARAKVLRESGGPISAQNYPLTRAESVRAVSADADPGDGSLVMGQGTELLIKTSIMTRMRYAGLGELYARIRRDIVAEFPRFTETDLHNAMMYFVPHALRIAMILTRDGKVLMRLKESGTQEKPASIIGLPQALQSGHCDTFDKESQAIARGAFAPFPRAGWHVEVDPLWGMILPNRPEVVLTRFAEFVGDPSIFFGVWTEERYYPFVWVGAGALAAAAEGDTSALISEVRTADEQYRAHARNMVTEIVIHESCSSCGQPLKAGSRKVLDKSCLTVSDALSLDETSRDVILSLETP